MASKKTNKAGAVYADGVELPDARKRGPTPAEINEANREYWSDAPGRADLRLMDAQLALDAFQKRTQPLADTGRRVREPFENANAERQAATKRRNAELQQLASEKWAEPQHATKSASDIAKLIDPDHWQTARRKIARPT